MLIKRQRITGTLLLCSAMLVCGGFAFAAFGESPCADKGKVAAAKKPCNICELLFGRKDKTPCEKKPSRGLCAKKAKKTEPACNPSPCPKSTADLPPNAEPGECYAKVMIPAQYKTVTERHLIQEASDRIEIVPAEFKWVEERITVKEPSTRLEIVPAEYKWKEKTIEVKPSHTGWVMQSGAGCTLSNKDALGGEVFCLRTTPPAYKTIRMRCLVKPACARQVAVPGEYQTIRRQVVACPPRTRRVNIPEEYENITRTVMVCAERVKWEHIVCEDKLTSDTVNKVKNALIVSGFKTGPLNGKFTQEDRVAMISFQQKHRLGVGQLSYETLKQLGVSLQ